MAKKINKKNGYLSLDISVYGREATASAFADYLESRTLLKQPITLAQLDEAVKDHSWKERDSGLIINEFNQDDEPTSWSDSVRSVVAERKQTLRRKYPFTIVRGALKVSSQITQVQSGYLRLLRLTVAHAYGYTGKPTPEVIFEQLVTEALKHYGLPSHGVGTGSRKSKQFVNALAEAASGVGLSSSPNPLPRRRYAKDGAVDVVSALNWHDGRPGQPTWGTQVTVGQSGTWIGKLKQPESSKWMSYLQERSLPQVMLAVPHHVEKAHFYEMLDARVGTVVDRLRLANHLPSVLPGEDAITAWFMELTPEL